MKVLVVNAGSSSLKLRMLDERDAVMHSADLPAPTGESEAAELRKAIEGFGKVDAAGHRIVHGGTRFVEPVIVDEQVLSGLRALTDLAPLHQPKSLAALDAVASMLPEVPAVACFDTAFHAAIPPAASTYALPEAWRSRWALKRYGFHGLSHAYVSRRAGAMLDRDPADLRLISCHLGAGASLAAVQGGHSVDTTMGFTPLEGLVMATRSGSVDPGLILWLEDHVGTPPEELAATLEYRSGLVGLAGTGDMREIVAAVKAGDEAAGLAFDVYVHRLRSFTASMAAAMGGVDALAFTGGVGENSPEVRAAAVSGLAFLGFGTSEQANRMDGGDRRVEPAGSKPVLVIHAREDLEIARQTRQVLGRSG